MATNTLKKTPVGAHTAGIFADMTVDGPEIGTLVVVIDRAKNLPNRKSMGKQDPYCAARLGKEAKKTDTDKRGGQTPRWDQELRFTVHDSPDYYRLKVSVFNDDKRTDLIGECWLTLEEIVVRGGGQNDHWHNLTFKGRYAGEIRIELTYYDIRPPETKVEERKITPQGTSPQVASRDGVAGPRQPKPLGRRPLPSNPTESSAQKFDSLDRSATDRAVPMPQQMTDHNGFSPNGLEDDHVQQGQNYSYEASDRPRTYPYVPGEVHDSDCGLPLNSSSMDHRQYQPYQMHSSNLASRPSQERVRNHSDSHTAVPSSRSEVSPGFISTGPNELHGLARPQPLRPGDLQQRLHDMPVTGPTPQAYNDYQDSQEDSFANDSRSWPELNMEDEEDSFAPPPPPLHRASGSRTSSDLVYDEPSNYAVEHPQHHSPSRSLRSSISASPLAQVHYAEEDPSYARSVSPLAPEQGRSYKPNYGSYPSTPQAHTRATHPPGRDRGMTTPASLIAGHNPRVHSIPVSRSQAFEPPPSRQVRHTPSPQTRQEVSPAPQVYTRAPPMPRDMFPTQDNRGHRHSAPLLNHTQSSPATELPKRKPVRPDPNSFDRRSSNVPFSPDSFDAFNPGLAAAQVPGNAMRPRYSTPEQAMESAAQHDRDSKRGDEPIIGNDGRVIDPSDHLPADTWAPEPDVKKRPEITVRIKPRIPLAEARPNAVSMPNIHSEPPRPQAGRTRLQKKSALGGDYHPNSSPIVPILDTQSGRAHAPRHYASDYRIRERENYEYGSGSPSPTYSRSPAERAPPPLPAKVPIEREHNFWEGDALSEELRSIDIGPGSGGRGSARRRGYGF